MKEDPSPCYYCKEHAVRCRIGCEKWDVWKNKHEERRESINKEKRKEAQLISYREAVNERISKHRRYHGNKEKGAKS